jgi:DNA mismatch repair protein MutL
MGQLDLTYLLYQGDRGLVLMDQHVAFEWIELDCLARGTGAVGGELCPVRAQQLLIPIGVDLRPELAMLASNNADLLAKIGFQVEPTDSTTVVVRGVPAGFSSRQPGPGEDRMDPIRLFRDVLERWATASTAEDRLTDAWAELACRRAVPAGQVVSRHEAERLLHALDRVACPAGLLHRRPLLIQYSLAEIDRRFSAH